MLIYRLRRSRYLETLLNKKLAYYLWFIWPIISPTLYPLHICALRWRQKNSDCASVMRKKFEKIFQFVSGKVKGRISKRWLPENKSTPNFTKYEHFLLLDTHTYVWVSRVKKCSFFEIFGFLKFILLPYYR